MAIKKFNLTKCEDFMYNPGGTIDAWAEDVSDGYHHMSELYAHRRALTAAFFNFIHNVDMSVRGLTEVMAKPLTFKTKLHNDGTMFPGYFMVMTVAPIGQISYHYGIEYWDQFRIPELERGPVFDGHTSNEVVERLLNF